MADYYTQFVISIDHVSATAKAWAEEAYPELSFFPENLEEVRPQTWTLLINSDTFPDLEEGIDFAQLYLKKFNPTGVITAQWANTCSKMRPGGFGGGAAVVTAAEVHFVNTHQWVAQMLAVLLEEAVR